MPQVLISQALDLSCEGLISSLDMLCISTCGEYRAIDTDNPDLIKRYCVHQVLRDSLGVYTNTNSFKVKTIVNSRNLLINKNPFIFEFKNSSSNIKVINLISEDRYQNIKINAEVETCPDC